MQDTAWTFAQLFCLWIAQLLTLPLLTSQLPTLLLQLIYLLKLQATEEDTLELKAGITGVVMHFPKLYTQEKDKGKKHEQNNSKSKPVPISLPTMNWYMPI